MRISFVVAGLIAALSFTASQAEAAFTILLTQVGNSVVATGSGSLNISALTLGASGTDFAQINPIIGTLVMGGGEPVTQGYGSVVGPSNCGTGGYDVATFGSGDVVGIGYGGIEVPKGYISGSPLADSDTYYLMSLTQLGVKPGAYVYTWGTGTTADSLTINIGTVPEPVTAAMISVPAAIALLRRRRRVG